MDAAQTSLRGVISMVDILLRASPSRFGNPSFPPSGGARVPTDHERRQIFGRQECGKPKPQ